jgi:UDP-glucose 4-epimerase
MATYLVTGGCGFIGSHLVDELILRGHAVRVLDDLSTGKRSNLPVGADLIVGDVAEPEVVAGAMRGADGCFHLAAVASVERGNLDWLGTHRTNLSGTVAVFDAARQAASGPIPVVFASSAAVYGENPDVPLTEWAATRPLSAYGADKLGCEQHALAAGRVHRIPTCGLRFFNVYGPRQDPTSPYSGVISVFCNRLKSGRGISVYGDGTQTRDFVYVADVVRALLAALPGASTDAPVYNVCTGQPVSILGLVETLSDLLGVTPEVTFAPPRRGEIRASLGSPARAVRDLHFAAQTGLRDGLAQTLGAL